MIYLASPYTHNDPKVEEARYQFACLATGRLIKEGQHVYSPIAHSRAIAQQTDLPTDFGFWAAYDTDMISKCDEVVVLTLNGWKESKGVQAEINIARALNKPIRYQNYCDSKEPVTKETVVAMDAGL